jgi:poly(3-hydroxybutyrate) depolymerase
MHADVDRGLDHRGSGGLSRRIVGEPARCRRGRRAERGLHRRRSGAVRRRGRHLPQPTDRRRRRDPLLLVARAAVGTGFTDDQPEEEWGIDELTAMSDALGFIVVRPRSHSYMVDGQTYYQWDLDAADLAGTLALTTQLLARIEGHYAVAPDRVYVAGFSNGTNMALQTLALSPNPFHGIGIVGGGIYYPF